MHRKVIGKVLALGGGFSPNDEGWIEVVEGVPADALGSYEWRQKYTTDEAGNIKNAGGADLMLLCPDVPTSSIKYKMWSTTVRPFEFFFSRGNDSPIKIQLLQLAGGENLSPDLLLQALDAYFAEHGIGGSDDGTSASNYFEIVDFEAISLIKDAININGYEIAFSNYTTIKDAQNAAELLAALYDILQTEKETGAVLEHLLFETDGISKLSVTYDKAGEIGNVVNLVFRQDDRGGDPSIELSGGVVKGFLKGGTNSLDVEVRGRAAAGKIVFSENPSVGDYITFVSNSDPVRFTFTDGNFALSEGKGVLIGATLAETLDGLAVGATDSFTQLIFTREGDNALQIVYFETGGTGNFQIVSDYFFASPFYINPAMTDGEYSLESRIQAAEISAQHAQSDATVALNNASSVNGLANVALAQANRALVSITVTQSQTTSLLYDTTVIISGAYIYQLTNALMASNRMYLFFSENNSTVRFQGASFVLRDGNTIYQAGTSDNGHIAMVCTGAGVIEVYKFSTNQYRVIRKTGTWTITAI